MPKRFDEEVNERRVLPKINEWFSKYTCQELQDALADKLPLTAIHTIDQVLEDPQLNARNMFIDYTYGSAQGKLFGTPIKLSETPCDTSGSAPEIGQHNAQVYKEFLGLSKAELDGLHEKGVL